MSHIIVLKAGLAYHRSHLLQTALIILGISLGVAVIVAIDMANTSVSRSFQYSTESLTGKTTHRIVGSRSGLDQAVYLKLRKTLGYRTSAPIIEGYVRVKELSMGNLKLLGVDPLSGNGADGASGIMSRLQAGGDLLSLLMSENRVVISEKQSVNTGIGIGDFLTLYSGNRPIKVQVAAVLKGQNSVSREVLSGVIIADISTAQEILGMGDRISRIDLVIDEANEQTILESISRQLPAGIEIVQSRRRNASVRQMTQAFELNLRAMSLLALLVGMFLIYNTITFTVVRRRKQIGILRALGTTRSGVFFMIVSETLVLGLIGSLLGLVLGILLGWGTVHLVMQTVSDLYFVLSVSVMEVSVPGLLKALFMGMTASFISALFPAYEAVRVSPVVAQRRSSVEAYAAGVIPFLTTAGVVMIGAGILVLNIETRRLDISFSGLFLIVFGSALLVPILARRIVGLLSILPGVRGSRNMSWALRNVSRSLSRTAVAIAALMIAVSVIVGVGIMVGSFRFTVLEWLKNTIVADIYIVDMNRNATGLDPSIINEIKRIEGIDQVYSATNFRLNSGKYAGATVFVIEQEISSREWIWKSSGDGELYDSFKAGSIFVSENFAWKYGIDENKEIKIQLPTQQGNRSFPVSGIFRDFSSRQGMIVMDADVFKKYWQSHGVSGLGLMLKPGYSPHPLMLQINRALAEKYQFAMSANADIRNSAINVFDRTFTITTALQILAALVAFIGVFNSIMSMMLERTHEIGIIRANGMTVAQLWRLVLTESGIIGVLSGLLAMPLGVAMAWILVFIINRRSFGWTLDFILEPRYFLQALGVALIASLAAGIYPARAMGRKNIAEALRTE